MGTRLPKQLIMVNNLVTACSVVLDISACWNRCQNPPDSISAHVHFPNNPGGPSTGVLLPCGQPPSQFNAWIYEQ